MEREVIISLSRELCLTAVNRFWWRYLGWRTIIEIAGGGVILVVLIPWIPQWLDGLLGGVLGCYAVMALAAYFIQRRRLLSALHALNPPEVRYILTDEMLIAVSSLGRSEVPWSLIKELWRFPEVWLLIFVKGHFSTLPIRQVDDAAREFILEKVALAGGKVA